MTTYLSLGQWLLVVSIGLGAVLALYLAEVGDRRQRLVDDKGWFPCGCEWPGEDTEDWECPAVVQCACGHTYEYHWNDQHGDSWILQKPTLYLRKK